MVKTAAYLASLPDFKKTIVLTGAMIPYAFGTSSDGFFNLGSALAFVQMLPEGIYIVMNGRFFEWDKVEKNLKTGYFEEK
jgi:L-asparaginase